MTAVIGSDHPRLARIRALRDDLGILSLYVSVDPALEAGVRPAWEIELARGLERVRSEADEVGLDGLDRCLRALAPELARLVDPTEHGRGRALFARVGAGTVETVTTQTPFGAEATLGTIPRIVPLLAVDDGCPVGHVLVGGHVVRVLESRLGSVEELAWLDVTPVVADGPERKGPAASNPLHAQHAVAQRERYERHLAAGHARLLQHAAGEVAGLARGRGWELAVVAGDRRATGPVRDALAGAGADVALVDRILDPLPSWRVLAELSPAVDSLRRGREMTLVERARDGAASGGRGAVGLSDVLGVLGQGRVQWLLLDSALQASGVVGADGELYAAGVQPPGLRPEELRAERMLADHMVLRALETGARVTVVRGEAAEALAEAEGVAALLRW